LAGKRTKPQREADARLCSELWELGYSQYKIEQILNARAQAKTEKDPDTGKIIVIEPAEVDYTVTQQTISKDLKTFDDKFIQTNTEFSKKLIGIKNKSIFRLELVIKQAFKQFELGKQERKKSKVTTENVKVDGKDLPDMPEINFDDMELLRKRTHNLYGSKLKKVLQKHYSLSDPRFLLVIIAAIEQINKLVGNYPEAVTEDKPDDSSIDNLTAALERSCKKILEKNKDS
jgi:hypothetical protein